MYRRLELNRPSHLATLLVIPFDVASAAVAGEEAIRSYSRREYAAREIVVGRKFARRTRADAATSRPISDMSETNPSLAG